MKEVIQVIVVGTILAALFASAMYIAKDKPSVCADYVVVCYGKY